MEDRLQHRATTHEPQRAHANRVCNPPRRGAKHQRTLLINEGIQGSRSGGSFPIPCKLQVAVHCQSRVAIPTIIAAFSLPNPLLMTFHLRGVRRSSIDLTWSTPRF